MSDTWSTVVEAEIMSRLATPDPLVVSARYRYFTADPYAVHIGFNSEPPITWVFARELLASGLDQPAGLGYVRIWPSPSGALVTIAHSSPNGIALLQVPRGPLFRFLRRTYVLVPRGQEPRHLDIDTAIARLLEH